MTFDFTLKAYARIIDAALASRYHLMGVSDWMDQPDTSKQVVVLRHDVDRRPEHALAMARLEQAKGAKATYYFRRVGSAFNPEIMRDVAKLGHEVGYHYEDFHLAKYDPAKAYALFQAHLAEFRAITPIKTIAMHGSPFAKFGNMELWKHHSFEQHGVLDCILSADWSEFVYFTDTGRSFDAKLTNLRDEIPGRRAPGVASSADVAGYLASQRPQQVQINVHPERWSDAPVPWLRQMAIDGAANTVKIGLRALRSK
jgi:hypothetical protein